MKPLFVFLFYLLSLELVAQKSDTVRYEYLFINTYEGDTISGLEYNTIIYSFDTIFFENFIYQKDTFIVENSNIFLVKNNSRFLFFSPVKYKLKEPSYNFHCEFNEQVGYFVTTLYEFIPKNKGFYSTQKIPYIEFEVNEYSKIDSVPFSQIHINTTDFALIRQFDVLYNPFFGILKQYSELKVYSKVLINLPKQKKGRLRWFPN